jgi:hypothetical protein
MDRFRKVLDAAGSAARTSRSVLDRLPRWALVTILVAALAIVGEVVFLLVQSDGGGETSSAAEESLPCDDRAADNAVSADRFAQEVRDLGTVPPLSNVLEIYDAKVVGCVDLTSDGIDEMVVQLLERDLPAEDLVDSPIPWAIYRAEGEQWRPDLIRTHVPGAQVKIANDFVDEVSTGFAAGDPVCCPTGEREGTVRWDGEGFTYRAAGGPRGRTIALADGEAAAIGGFDVQAGSLPAAIEFFGLPSSYAPQGDLCPVTWDDLGLAIEFAQLGGLDPCSEEGRVGILRIEGSEAAQFGWQTQEGATVDMAEKELRKRYPDMRPQEETGFVPEQPLGELFTLVDRPSSADPEGVTPTLSARVDAGRAIGFEVAVGAAGE